MSQPLMELAMRVAGLLERRRRRIVFAESCTGGLVSAVLARVPGISEFLCGSAVVYRLDTKSRWLGVCPKLLLEAGPVSDPVARAMALGALQQTPEADLSAAITGHLGPNAPMEQDGLTYVAIARRTESLTSDRAETSPDSPSIFVFKDWLGAPASELDAEFGESLREWRQWKGAELVLSLVANELQGAFAQ